MIVNIDNQQTDLSLSLEQVDRIVQTVIAFEKQTCSEVNVYFVDTPTICRLHGQFFDDPSPTDCISFPFDEETESDYRLLGEIFICPATAIEYSLANQSD